MNVSRCVRVGSKNISKKEMLALSEKEKQTQGTRLRFFVHAQFGAGPGNPKITNWVHGICLIVCFHSTGSAQIQLAPMWSERDKLVPWVSIFGKPCTFPTTTNKCGPAWCYGPYESITMLLHGTEHSVLVYPTAFKKCTSLFDFANRATQARPLQGSYKDPVSCNNRKRNGVIRYLTPSIHSFFCFCFFWGGREVLNGCLCSLTSHEGARPYSPCFNGIQFSYLW